MFALQIGNRFMSLKCLAFISILNDQNGTVLPQSGRLLCFATGRTIVHEWGHLRWGLPDEYPIAGKETFYRDSENEVTAVKCGKHLRGKHVDYNTGLACTLDRTTGLPTRSCYFQPDKYEPGVSASLMFSHKLSQVNGTF